MDASLTVESFSTNNPNCRLRKWSFVHKWSSLICTIFLLMLCMTGAPLIFHHEIEALSGDLKPLPNLPAAQESQRGNIDVLISNALKAGQAIKPQLNLAQYLLFDPDDSRRIGVVLNTRIAETEETGLMVNMDGRTGLALAPPKPESGFMYVMLKLHTDLFAGIIGTLFLGLMGLLFVVAIISGIVLYSPFMRKLNFAEIRTNKTKQIKWLDWHNLLGIATMSWLIVVGFTGSINTIGDPLIKFWQVTEMAKVIAPYNDLSSVEKPSSVDKAIKVAANALPDMQPYVIALPGTPFASKRHINIYMRGETPLTARLYKPILIDGETNQLIASVEPPWYLKAFFLSQPLHFGDYAGLPMKFLWLVLDMLAIFVLWTGLYLWWAKRKNVA